MDQIETEGRTLELAIARRIRRRRQKLNWTLEVLAGVTGLSKGHLSQIENGEKVPPISTLTKIAYGLGTNIGLLITGENQAQNNGKISVGRVEDRMPIVHTEASPTSVYESFGFNKQNRIMDTYIITIGHEFPPRALMHIGQEFIYTLEGVHEFYYDGQTYRLQQGDVIYFDSDRPHMGRSLSKEPAKVLVVFCNTTGIS